jgi:transcriptional regulator
MHPNRSFAWNDEAAVLDVVRNVGFMRLFAQTPKGPRVAHVPVLVGPGRVLRFHLANGNALIRHIEDGTALALIEEPNAYLSANWYADVRGAVPSWNYVAVEIEGSVRRVGRAALIHIVDDLSAHLEPKVGEDWTRAKMDPDRFEALLSGIKGFELSISELRGTRKLSQNKADDEAFRVITGMERTGQAAMAAAMRTIRELEN